MSERGGVSGLEERVERLELEVEDQGRSLRRVLALLDVGSEREEAAGLVGAVEEGSSRVEAGVFGGGEVAAESEEGGYRLSGDFAGERDSRGWEWWLGKIGIGLLLFGVAFLFRFSVDQGWITPSLRVGAGLLTGLALLFLGLRVYEERRVFSQVLLGGGIGALYITGFAAYGLLGLVSWPVAFGFMSIVTALAFALSVRQDSPTLSIIASVGGLSTPFIFYTDDGTVAGLVLYTCVILAGAVAVHLRKGWRSLLVSVFIGVWTVFLIGGFMISFDPTPLDPDRAALQAGAAFGWLAFWLSPVVREFLSARRARPAERGFPGDVGGHFVAVVAPLAALWITQEIWSLEARTIGLVALAAAAAYTLVASLLYRAETDETVAYVQALVALFLATISLPLLLDGNALYFALALEGAVLLFAARQFSLSVVALGAHALFASVALWFTIGVSGDLLFSGYTLDAVDTLTRLSVIVLAFLASFTVTASVALVYRVAAQAATLAWLWSLFASLPDSEVLTTISWGVFGVVLAVTGLRRDRAFPLRAGMITLFIVVGKLFLVDLIWVQAIWRILLFLGFGGVFLILSYYLRSLWRPESQRNTAARDS